MAESQVEFERFVPSFGQQDQCCVDSDTYAQSLYFSNLSEVWRLAVAQEQTPTQVDRLSETLRVSVARECEEFCKSRGLVSVLEEYLSKVKELFSNIVRLSAELDYFMDDESSDEGHIAIRIEVASDQKTAIAEYDKWVDWVVNNIAVENRDFFTLVVRRV